MAEVKEKGKLLWKKASELKEDKVIGRKQIGDVYIENSKHERKATGSYYTPHYVVSYIVKNTVGAVLDEKLKSADKLLAELEDATKALRKQSAPVSIKGYKSKITEIEDKIFDSIFGISVLDPAMGSGHFLVHTVDFISDRIVSFLAGYPENPVIRKIHELRGEILTEIKRQGVRIDESKLTEVNLIKRMVMKRCIYGVDLNDMAVELAKLSLWLDSFTLGAPLSFLDHHLKCGNSLIGTNIEELEKALTGQLFAINLEPLKRAIRDMIFVSDLPDATMEQVRESYKKFGEANRGLEGYRILLDMLIAEHFGIPKAKDFLILDVGRIDLNKLKDSLVALSEKDRQIITQVEAVSGEKRFFHWEIEFPEVFYEKTAEFGQKIDKKENSGFDCVLGNPPWVSLIGRFRKSNEKDAKEIDYLHSAYGSNTYMPNYYENFVLLSTLLLKDKGNASFIIPDRLTTNMYYSLTRKTILNRCIVRSLNYSVKFPGVIADCLIYVFTREKQTSHNYDVSIASNFNFQRWANISEVQPDEYVFPRSYSPTALPILIKCEKKGIFPFGTEIMTTSGFGASSGKITDELVNKKQVPVLKGDNIDRYQLNGCYYNDFQENPITGRTCDFNILKKKPKLLLRKTGLELIATIDNTGTIVEQSLYFLYDNNTDFNFYFLLSLLNSTLLTFYFQEKLITNKESTAQIKKMDLDKLPIPRISFTTPEKERKKFFKEAIKLYERSKYDDVIKWADYELALGRTDTSHDFLAYLAEQMIEMNKTKNVEIKGFLTWLEREIGAEVENLANKTAIKEYHEHDFDHVLEVLKKNKNKISVDPSSRKTQELLEKHFTKSMLVLEPLKEKIKNTDNLIDQIVYKLYGLTEEDIEIVEGILNIS